MSVCAIILDYFGADKTEKCLMSLASQGIKTIYLLDNSGSHSISEKLTSAVARVLATGVDFKVEILSVGANLGFSKGVNFVLAHDRRSGSSHDYYLLLNNDAVAGPSLVTGLMAALKQNPGAVIVGPRVISNGKIGECGAWYHRYLGLLLSRSRRFCFHYLSGCCLFFRQDLVRDNGLFDEAFFMYGEDAELGWRLARAGRQIVCATEVFVKHEAGSSSNKTGLFYEYHIARGHVLLGLRTWVHPVEIPLIMLAKFFALASRAIVRCFRHRSLVPFAAFFLAWFPLRMERAAGFVYGE